ncbi:MAG: hypothetical protein AAFN81_11515 [Bacteroidota bacterium]
MNMATVFQILSGFFLLLAAYFGYTYFTGDRAEEDVAQLILTLSNTILAVAMFILSRNKAFIKKVEDEA